MKADLQHFKTMSLLILVLAWSAPVHAGPGDTTWVHTFDHDFYNWATSHVDTFTFPDTTVHYNQIVLFYTIGCPPAPNDCDPWDRLGHLQVLHDTGEIDTLGQPILEPYEIARVITPYDITGFGRPDSCTWQLDVTDYMSLLHDTVILSNYIESWIGGDDGWLVTIDFAFIEGDIALEPFRVVNLWQDYYVLFGDPDVPIEDDLPLLQVDIDEEAVEVKLRVTTTGHGQGNTDNCAEFCYKEHMLHVNNTIFSYYPWRDDCNQNPCSPQGGSWTYSRAGWCPGDAVEPWDQDITANVIPGRSAKFQYTIEPYENLCRPTNPDCVSGITCPDCEFNYQGHTPPHYSIQSQLVFYREGAVGVGDGDRTVLPLAFALHQNYPNPFNPSTTISFELVRGLTRQEDVSLSIYSVRGKRIRTLIDSKLEAGRHEVVWDGRDDTGVLVPSGIYIYTLATGNHAVVRKMLLLK